MLVFLINGLSFSGKTKLIKEICKKNNEYNFIKSYTTRKQRNKNDDDHFFVSKDEITFNMYKNRYVASTIINNEIYTAFEYQFSENKPNFYIVDDLGFLDIRNHIWGRNISPTFVKIRVKREISTKEKVKHKKRINRFQPFIKDKYFDYIIFNDNFDDTIKVFDEIIKNEIYTYIQKQIMGDINGIY